MSFGAQPGFVIPVVAVPLGDKTCHAGRRLSGAVDLQTPGCRGTLLAPSCFVVCKRDGFTVLELLVAVAVIGILAAIAIPAYQSYRIEAYDTAARSDLRNAMTVVESANAGNLPLPNSPAQLAQQGHRLSPGVTFTRFALRSVDGAQSVHMHTKHQRSPHTWHADYPAQGSAITMR